VQSGDGVTTWDIVHFPQIATTGAKQYVARIAAQGLIPQTVTTASPGVASNDPATLKTDTSGQNQGPQTLAAGTVRHGMMGDQITHQVIVAGAAPSLVYGITVTVES